MSKVDVVIETAESLIGCPYIYGTWGKAICTPSLRIRYANYNPEQKAITYKRCQRLRDSSQKDTCAGCKYEGKLAMDCRGFTHYCMAQAGIEITGGYVGRQWSDANWAEKGDIAAMPDLVCCVFVYKAGKWKHTGLHIGGGRVIHCSGEVKYDSVTGGDNAWTHYAIPKGLYTAEEIASAHKERGIFVRTLKKGDQGEDVRSFQEMLSALGYDVGARNGKSDGVYGEKTQAAVLMIQKANGLTLDGAAGPETLALIEKKYNELTGAAPEDPPTQPELPEDDDDDLDAPLNLVILTHAEAQQLIDTFRRAIAILENAMQ